MSDGELGDKLRAYFRDLAPEARLMLGTGLARAGGALPHGDMILGALKGAMQDNGEILPLDDMTAVVLAPCFSFSTKADKEAKAPGVISFSSLDKVWRWLETDGAMAAISHFREGVDADPLGRATPEAVEALRAACTKAITDAASHAEKEPQGVSRMAVRLGSDRAAEDLQDIGAALRYEKVLETFAGDIAGDIRLGPDDAVAAMKGRLALIARKAKPAMSLAFNLVKTRLGTPAATVRLMIALGATSKVELLLDSPYRGLFEMIMSDAERAVLRAQASRASADSSDLVAAIRDFGATLRAIGSELEFDSRSATAKRINNMRKSMSEALGGRMTDLTQRVKQLIRPRTDAKGVLPVMDPMEVERLDSDIAVLMVARNYADDIALKADTLRVYGEIKNLLDTGMPLLIDRLRSLPMDQRGDIRGRLEAVVRLSRRLVGEEYAVLLLKAIHVADVPAPVRKVANG
jgi:hypothetical protein